jgi:hypothetical protein
MKCVIGWARSARASSAFLNNRKYTNSQQPNMAPNNAAKVQTQNAARSAHMRTIGLADSRKNIAVGTPEQRANTNALWETAVIASQQYAGLCTLLYGENDIAAAALATYKCREMLQVLVDIEKDPDNHLIIVPPVQA